jgi:hypothetical protein
LGGGRRAGDVVKMKIRKDKKNRKFTKREEESSASDLGTKHNQMEISE